MIDQCNVTKQNYSVVDTLQQFVEQDLNWYSSLGDTKWLQLVAQCLTASQDVADLVIKGDKAVVIQGKTF